MHASWIVPRWPAHAAVKSVFTTRQGGASKVAFESLNLGDHVGDESGAVQSNRSSLSSSLNARPVFLNQVHKNDVVQINRSTRDGTVADGCFTSSNNVACTIMVADCLPVLFAARDGSTVGAAHAGWRGLAGGVLSNTHESMNLAPASTIAWLGPCIGPAAFEVGEDVVKEFARLDGALAAFFTPSKPGKWLGDLPGIARWILHRMGVAHVYGNDGTDAWCTVGNPLLFFSHRRDRVSGRMAACIWRD